MLGTKYEQFPPPAPVLTFLPETPDQADPPVLPPRPRRGRGAPMAWQVPTRIEERRARMRAEGARLLSQPGATGVAIADVARAAHVPVSPSAHGYRRRAELMFDILYAYVDALHEAVGEAVDSSEALPPRTRLRVVIRALLDGVRAHQDAHRLMVLHHHALNRDQLEALRYQIRTLFHRAVPVLEAAEPVLAERREMQGPLVQTLIGLVSHTPSWLREDGSLSWADYADVIAESLIAAARALPAR